MNEQKGRLTNFSTHSRDITLIPDNCRNRCFQRTANINSGKARSGSWSFCNLLWREWHMDKAGADGLPHF